MSDELVTLPLPADPTLSRIAATLNDTGHWALVLDPSWHLVFVTDELRRSWMETGRSTGFAVGQHWFGPHEVERRVRQWSVDGFDHHVRYFLELGPYVLHDSATDRRTIRGELDSRLRPILDDVEPREPPTAWVAADPGFDDAGMRADSSILYQRIRDDNGRLAGTIVLAKPRAGMSQLGLLASVSDLTHLERLVSIRRPGRRPTAVLMADLEASTQLLAGLTTEQYFLFQRRFVRDGDRSVIDRGGLVGRHAGDGLVAFFMAETNRSESETARHAVETAHDLQSICSTAARRSGLPASRISLRVGLHWGASVFVGRITSAGRTESMVLGREVNETARVEACAPGGSVLATDTFVAHLTDADLTLLGVDRGALRFEPLATFASATSKVRRDAGPMRVCALPNADRDTSS